MKRIVVLAAVLIAISTVSVNAAATTVPESVYACLLYTSPSPRD